MTLAELLFSQGFGTRRECAGLIASGWVTIAGEACTDASREVDPHGVEFTVRGEAWTYRERALLVMNKPAGHECSQKPRHHPSVYALLPAPLRRRGVQAIGRDVASARRSLASDTPATPDGMPAGGLVPSRTMRSRGTPK